MTIPSIGSAVAPVWGTEIAASQLAPAGDLFFTCGAFSIPATRSGMELSAENIGRLPIQTLSAIAKSFPGKIETAARHTVAAIHALRKGDAEELDRICDGFKNWLDRWETIQTGIRSTQKPGSEAEMEWLHTLFSSANQLGISLFEKMARTRLLLNRGEHWDNAVRPLAQFRFLHRVRVAGTYGYSVPRTHTELAQVVINWLERNCPERRVNDEGKIEFYNRTGFLFSGNFHFHPQWPPNRRDIHLRRFLKTLGWKIQVQNRSVGGDLLHVIVLDFGSSAIRPRSPSNKLRRAPGIYEVTAFTPTDVERLNSRQKLLFARQLLRTIREMCQLMEFNRAHLEKGNVMGLSRLTETLAMESKRFTRLFPHFSDPSCAALMRHFKLAAIDNYVAGILAAMRDAVKQIENGAGWEETLKTIFPFHEVRKENIEGDFDLEVDRMRLPLATLLVQSLRPAAESSQIENGIWTLRFRRPPTAGFLTIWPPAPADDPPLKTLLAVLGWRMKVETTPDGVTVQITFPEN